MAFESFTIFNETNKNTSTQESSFILKIIFLKKSVSLPLKEKIYLDALCSHKSH